MALDETKTPDRLLVDIPLHSLGPNREAITVVWFNPVLSKAKINSSTMAHLRLLRHYVLIYTDQTLCVEYLTAKMNRWEHIILVIEGAEVSDEVYQCDQVKWILFVRSDDRRNSSIREEKSSHCSKMVTVCEDEESVVAELTRVIENVQQQTSQQLDGVFKTLGKKERSLRDLHAQLGSSLWCRAFAIMAKAMPQSSDALQQMLEECRSYYQHNPSQMAKIDEFERTYRREDAIKWYTQDNFVHRIVNKALRTEDVEALHLFRYFITDLSDGLKAARSELLITRVYRGGILSRDEVEKYQAGYRVETNAFFSCSGDPTVAHSFISLDPHTGTTSSQGRDDEEQFAIFEIDIDPRHASTVTLADISNESLFQQENEILFDMGTTFEIISSDYDDRQHIWRIRMQTSETDPSLYDRYHKYLDERMKETSVHVLFGILLADMGEYGKTLTYFENLLKRLPDDHEDRPNIYYSMSRAYRFLSDHEAALKYLSQAEELQRARLPESNFDYARTLAGIGSVYYELRQYDQELKYYKQAMVIYQQILPDNHLEIARSLNRLGFASFNQHLYSEALDYFDRSLNTYQNLVPDGYPGLAQVIYNLGLVHHVLGNSDQTLHFYQEALRQTAKILPDDHLHMALPCYRLGVFHFEQEQLDLALEYAQRALEIRQKKLAPDHALLREAHEMVTQIQSRLTI